MEKDDFLDLAKNYTSLTIEEALAIDELQQSYPYSQVIHCLATRGARDHQLEKSGSLLALSAVYATDRTVLKAIMTAPRTARTSSTHAIESPQVASAAAETTDETVTEAIDRGLSGEALNHEIMLDLDRLQKLKHDFEVSFMEYARVNQPGYKSPETNASPTPVQKKEVPVRHQRKAKPADDLIPEPSGESILAEIASTKKRVAPGTEKQKEQIEIIDQFISKQPSISRPQPTPGEVRDLSEKSADLIDSMVSETLVEILLRQGKKDKAIEVLRKLIWKFPQKKAIFAAQIDELKK